MTATRPSVLSRLALAACLGGTLVLPACLVRLGSGWDETNVGGRSVSVDGDSLTVDGTHLPYSRWVDVDAAAAGAGELHFATATGPIELAGSPAGFALQARLWSEFEGDGRVELRGGELVATSDRGGVVFVNEIKGSVPPAAQLKLESGTGPVAVSGLAGAPSLKGTTGTGELVLSSCEVRAVDLESGTGDIVLRGGHCDSIAQDLGTGDLQLLEGVTVGAR